MTYYIYHIPGKKIGVTCDLNNRVTVQQGYDSTEYEILENSDDIDYISSKEIELQREYGLSSEDLISSITTFFSRFKSFSFIKEF